MNPRCRVSLSVWMCCFTAIVVVTFMTLLFLGWVAYHKVQSAVVRQTGEHLSLLAMNVARSIEWVIDERTRFHAWMSQMIAGRVHHPEALIDELQRMQRVSDLLECFAIVDPSGKLLATTDVNCLGQKLHGSPWFDEARRHSGIRVWDAERIAGPSGQMVVTITGPIVTTSGDTEGILICRIRISELPQIFEGSVARLRELGGWDNRIGYELRTGSGLVMLDSWGDDHSGSRTWSLRLADLTADPLLTAGYDDVVDRSRPGHFITAFARTAGIVNGDPRGWIVVLSVPKEAVLATLLHVLGTVSFVGGVVILLVVGGLGWLLRSLVRAWVEADGQRQWVLTLIESLRDGVIATDRDGLVVLMNPAAESLTGWSSHEAHGQPVQLILRLETQSHAGLDPLSVDGIVHLASVEHGYSVHPHSLCVKRRDGAMSDVELLTSAIVSDRKTALGVVLVLRDDRGRRWMDLRRAIVEDVSKALMTAERLEEAVPEVLCVLCLAMRWEVGFLWLIDDMTPGLRCVGYWAEHPEQLGELINMSERMSGGMGIGLPGVVVSGGQPSWILDGQFDSADPRARVAKASGLLGSYAFPLQVGHEVLGCIEVFAPHLAVPDGDLLALGDVVGSRFVHQIHRWKAVESIRRSEERFVYAARATNDVLWEWTIRTDGMWWNDGVSRCFGYSQDPAQLQRAWWVQHVHPECRARVCGHLQVFLNGDGDIWTQEYWFETADGRYAFVVDRGIVMRDDAGQPVRMIGAMTDWTERKEMMEAVATERERLEVTLRSIGDGVITTCASGRIRLMNVVAEEWTGWRQDQATGLPLSEVYRPIQATSSPDEIAQIDPALFPGRRIQLDGCAVLESRDGRQRIIETAGAAIRSPSGEFLGMVLVIHDVTSRLHQEDEALTSLKLESLGVLAGGLAHDFNNLLSAIVTNLGLIKMSLPTTQVVRRSVEDVERAVMRASGLTKQLLTFATGGLPVTRRMAIGEGLVEWSTFALRGSVVQCEAQIAPNLWSVQVDDTQMSQVIHNVVLNARQAMRQGGRITLQAENVVMDEAYGIEPWPVGLVGRCVRIRVVDTGCGIPPEMLSRVLDPYFSTNAGGRGLGLTMAYSIVRHHGGAIRIDSTLGVGTTVTIVLPAVDGAVDGQVDGDHHIVIGQGRILIVDDDVSIRQSLGSLLQSCGYGTVAVADGVAAVAAYREGIDTGQCFDAVILDLIIAGGMGAQDTVTLLRCDDPSVKAIVMSGSTTDPLMQEYLGAGFLGRIEKPCLVEQVSREVYRVVMLDHC